MLLPLKQGLKRGQWKQTGFRARVVMLLPLKQGLKLACTTTSSTRTPVVMLLPLKQGLKLYLDCISGRSFRGCYATSIKTRIET